MRVRILSSAPNFMVFLGLALLLKHYLADWYMQSLESSVGKRDTGWTGIKWLLDHSFDHATVMLLTLIIVGVFLTSATIIKLAIIISVLDFVLHFVIDYLKIKTEKFFAVQYKSKQWFALLVADQGAHVMCYVLYMYLIFGGVA